jgi:hypothetical protein
MEFEKGKPNSLQPSTILEILDRTFRIYRENFLTFLVPIALVSIPIAVINLIGAVLYSQRLMELQPTLRELQNISRNPSVTEQTEILRASGELFSVAIIYLGMVAITALLQVVLVQGIMTQIGSESHLGHRVTAGEAFRAMHERLMPLTGAVILEFIIFIFLVIGVGVISVFMPLCAILIFPLIYVWLALSTFTPAVLVLERTGISFGLRRAWSLGKARIWQIMGLTLALGIITAILTFGLQALLGVFVPTSEGFNINANDVINLVIQTVISTLISPIVPIAFTLLYYDARVRLEGLDIAFESSGINDPRPSDFESPQPNASLLSSKDIGNMGILTIIVCGIFGVAVCGLLVLMAPFLSNVR